VPLPPFEGAAFDLFVSVPDDGGTSTAALRGVQLDGVAKLDFASGVPGVSPDDNASNVTAETPFTWSATASALLWMAPVSPSRGTPSFFVLAADGHGHLPDISALDGVIPSGTSYDWYVSTTSTWTDFDNAVEFAWAARPVDLPEESRGWQSPKRRFVTK
jgi:hypothetical protein